MKIKAVHLEHTIEKFKEEAEAQELKGFDKYGKPLDPLDGYDWLAMASQELVDAFKYFEAERVKRKHVFSLIRDLTDDKKIHELLEFLEGEV